VYVHDVVTDAVASGTSSDMQ
ncbi:hypothetical protein A2U01_0109591, partial [Trifolium medium]|nr:hypothetical protein [Trifolium medium]